MRRGERGVEHTVDESEASDSRGTKSGSNAPPDNGGGDDDDNDANCSLGALIPAHFKGGSGMGRCLPCKLLESSC